MSQQPRWDPCVAHCGEETDEFLDGHFGQGIGRFFWLRVSGSIPGPPPLPAASQEPVPR